MSKFTPTRWIIWGFAAAAFGLLAWAVVPNWGNGDPLGLFVGSLPWVLLVVFWVAFIPYSQMRAARKLPDRDASVLGRQERLVDEFGYHSRGNGVALDVPWHAMARAVETEQFFLFFYNKECAYYIPKRVLAEDQVARVRELMLLSLGARAQVLRPR